MDQAYWVYILSSGPHRTIYVGVTNSLERRIADHKAKQIKGFTATYDVDRLVYFQLRRRPRRDPLRKQHKRWRRSWKVRLIEETNPHWPAFFQPTVAKPPQRNIHQSALDTEQHVNQSPTPAAAQMCECRRTQAKTGMTAVVW